MTEGHKHRIVRVKRDGWAYRVLCKPIYHTTDTVKVDASPYPYGLCLVPNGYYLSLLSILHRWTGLTLETKGPKQYRVEVTDE